MNVRLAAPMIAMALLLTSPLAALADMTKSATVETKADPEQFRSDAARIEMKKPKSWRFSTVETALTNRAKVKMKDMNTDDLEAAARTLAGSARSMGLQVTE